MKLIDGETLYKRLVDKQLNTTDIRENRTNKEPSNLGEWIDRVAMWSEETIETLIETDNTSLTTRLDNLTRYWIDIYYAAIAKGEIENAEYIYNNLLNAVLGVGKEELNDNNI